MNRLKELRQEKKLSQKEIADFLSVNEKTISRWEKSESTIKSDKAQKLADFFGVSTGYLLGYVNKEVDAFFNSSKKALDEIYNDIGHDDYKKKFTPLINNFDFSNENSKITNILKYVIEDFSDFTINASAASQLELLTQKDMQQIKELHNKVTHYIKELQVSSEILYSILNQSNE